MNHDPVYQRLREMGWRRALTAAEKAELRAWVAAHPETRADIQEDAALNAALAKLTVPPVSSNFTARVMEAIKRDEAALDRADPRPQSRWWRVLIPRFAVAVLVIASGTLGYRHYAIGQRNELVMVAKQIAAAQVLSDMTVIEDFETIRRLNPAGTTADEKLLAMSDDLLALNQ